MKPTLKSRRDNEKVNKEWWNEWVGYQKCSLETSHSDHFGSHKEV